MTATGYTLWGTPHSLYTGKLRSYLIKKRISFAERLPNDPRFASEVVPGIGHFVIPVLSTPDGALIQDTTAIIDYLEARHAAPSLTPPGPVQQVIAHLLDAFGSNYLLPLAMHYRWSYRDRQELFLQTEFARAIPAAMPYEQRLATAQMLMGKFAGFLPNLGVCAEVIPAMEESYAELLGALEAHFRAHPYLLGGCPSLADFGMMAPLYAHLARDPVPGFLMRTIAPNVAHWTERMNQAEVAAGDYADPGGTFPDGDAIPETLEAVLALVFAHWGPGLAEDAAQFDRWLDLLDDPAPGTLVSHDGERQVHPHVGAIAYPWRGVTMRRKSHPHSLWHLARAQAAARTLDPAAAARFAQLLERTGGTQTMALTTTRPIARENNVLVLA
ncbi:MAG: glutathione S-transferase [Novosphingobium sp.]|uniref:glutathione S-transferase family protein n=1 Tax=Novosphingobium sp. TaxID=1874826 RepID=UPI001E0B5948|nr:glutathione S-transferase family protein [Novosphingobium sp.]MCB2057848.1 glutathione S-transferase [Novosphingobium sp.]MCP5385639.1 glutathione S-transferase [Novosphingobium sp.]